MTPITEHEHASDTVLPDGFEGLDVCHRQTRFALGRLAALTARLATHGADDEARALAAQVVNHYATTARGHHEDEERHVFPRLLDGADPAIVQAVQRLQEDHHWLEENWRELAPQLRAIAEGQCGVHVDALCEGVRVFTALSQDHMALEEACVFPQARTQLTAGERRAIGRAIAARRRTR